MAKVWHDLLGARLTRRDAIRAAAGMAGAASLPLDLRAHPASSSPVGGSRVWGSMQAPFTPIAPTREDALVLPGGYDHTVLRVFGDHIAPGVPFGYNADYTAFFPVDAPDGGRSSTDGLLWVNHEFPNPLLMYGYRGGAKSAAEIRAERESVGGSVLRVRRGRDGRWSFVPDARNRRVTGFTPCRLTGPVAGSPVVGGAVIVDGSVGNCSGGVTPWGTVLSCEENVDEYAAPIDETGTGFGWDTSYVKEHQGWVTEVDPYDPSFVPRKRTALGRFRHENVAVRLGADGRVVAYMGDDRQDSCVYKFVSDGAYVPTDREANLRLLDRGTLYAADFGTGRWIALDLAADARLRDARSPDGAPLFSSQAQVLLNAPAAAVLLGATPVDRPEDVEVHPRTGEVYIALTNNTRHGNFHGQIVRLREEGGRADARAFEWEFFAVGGRQSGFSSPDNLVFDPFGNLWMTSDISSNRVAEGIYAFQGNNSLFFLPTEGPDAGRAFQFASGPVQCELTGPFWSPDGTTLFLGVQHPGEESTSLSDLTSHWPARDGRSVPRPGVVAITGFPAWGAHRFPYW